MLYQIVVRVNNINSNNSIKSMTMSRTNIISENNFIVSFFLSSRRFRVRLLMLFILSTCVARQVHQCHL